MQLFKKVFFLSGILFCFSGFVLPMETPKGTPKKTSSGTPKKTPTTPPTPVTGAANMLAGMGLGSPSKRKLKGQESCSPKKFSKRVLDLADNPAPQPDGVFRELDFDSCVAPQPDDVNMGAGIRRGKRDKGRGKPKPLIFVEEEIAAASTTTTPTAAALQVGPIAIYHAFDETMQEVIEKIPQIAKAGFSHIQISPIQISKSKSQTDAWWAAYQPFGYEIVGLDVGGKYGRCGDLQRLIQIARENGLEIIVDVVLNHFGLDLTKEEWDRYFEVVTAKNGSQKVILKRTREELSTLILEKIRKPFGSDDIDWCSDKWMGVDLPILKWDSEKVRLAHEIFLSKLISVGVTGFRFDAAKHIQKEFLDLRFNFIKTRNKNCFCYGEVLNACDQKYKEFESIGMSVTDDTLACELNKLFRKEGSFANGSAIAFIKTNGVNDSITFARSHDNLMNPGMRHSAVDATYAELGCCFILSRQNGFPLILNKDFWKEHGPSKKICNAIKFRRKMKEAGNPGEFVHEVQHDGANLLIMQRLGRGIVFINKGKKPISLRRIKVDKNYFDLSDKKIKLIGQKNFIKFIESSERGTKTDQDIVVYEISLCNSKMDPFQIPPMDAVFGYVVD